VVRKNYVPPRFTPPSNDDSPDEYNKAVRDCDIFVSLFFTKAGKFTEEEFDVALGVFKKKGKPRLRPLQGESNMLGAGQKEARSAEHSRAGL